MKLVLKRLYPRATYTVGKLFIDGRYFCDTIEDADRGLCQNMPLNEIKKRKKNGITAIPTGTYSVTLNVISPRLSKKTFYKEVCGGCVPRLLDVPGFDGVLIHCGNTAEDSEGCILVGENKAVGKVLNSQKTFRRLWNIIKAEKEITISIE